MFASARVAGDSTKKLNLVGFRFSDYFTVVFKDSMLVIKKLIYFLFFGCVENEKPE